MRKKITNLIKFLALLFFANFLISCGVEVQGEDPNTKVNVSGMIKIPLNITPLFSHEKVIAFRKAGCSLVDFAVSEVGSNGEFSFSAYTNSTYVIVLTDYDQYQNQVIYSIVSVDNLADSTPAEVEFHKDYDSGTIEINYSEIDLAYHVFNITYDPNNYYNGKVVPFATVRPLSCDILSVSVEVEFYLQNYIYREVYQFVRN